MANWDDFLIHGFEHTVNVSESQFIFKIQTAAAELSKQFGVFPKVDKFKIDKDTDKYSITGQAENLVPKTIRAIRVEKDRLGYEMDKGLGIRDKILTENGLIWTPIYDFREVYNGKDVWVHTNQSLYIPSGDRLRYDPPQVLFDELGEIIVLKAISSLKPSNVADGNIQYYRELFMQKVQSKFYENSNLFHNRKDKTLFKIITHCY